MTTHAPSMNAMVDAVTDAVEAAVARGNDHLGGVPRFILQGAMRRVLHDIHNRCIAPRRFHGNGPNAGGCPTTPRPVPRSPRLEYAVGICPHHGPAMFVHHVRATPAASPKPSSLPKPSSSMPPPTPPPSIPTPAQPWNGGGGVMAGRRDATALLNSDFTMAAWPPGFAYDLDVVLPRPALPPIGPSSTRMPSYASIGPSSTHALSYADITANRGQGPRRSTNGAISIVSSSVQWKAVPPR